MKAQVTADAWVWCKVNTVLKIHDESLRGYTDR
jgi:hypothetical protein